LPPKSAVTFMVETTLKSINVTYYKLQADHEAPQAEYDSLRSDFGTPIGEDAPRDTDKALVSLYRQGFI